MAAASRAVSWAPLVAATIMGAAAAGAVGWRLHVASLEQRITQKRAGLKKQVLSGKIPPNEDVMRYLTERQAAVEGRYERWLERVVVGPLAEAAAADPQLYFQEQFHQVQGTLERLAVARQLPVPEVLGFPKELPPSDTVPRLLVQLALIQQAAELIYQQGGGEIASLKIEDPQAVPEPEAEQAFLLRLPVRVRLRGSLRQALAVVAGLQRSRPLVDVRGLRLVADPATERLDAELVLARYLDVSGAPAAEPPAARVPARRKAAAGRREP
jgi:hypothetical protein